MKRSCTPGTRRSASCIHRARVIRSDVLALRERQLRGRRAPLDVGTARIIVRSRAAEHRRPAERGQHVLARDPRARPGVYEISPLADREVDDGGVGTREHEQRLRSSTRHPWYAGGMPARHTFEIVRSGSGGPPGRTMRSSAFSKNFEVMPDRRPQVDRPQTWVRVSGRVTSCAFSSRVPSWPIP